VPTSHIREYARSTVDDQEEVLHLAVKQYIPKKTFSATHKVTIVGAHANGFPKVRSTSSSLSVWRTLIHL